MAFCLNESHVHCLSVIFWLNCCILNDDYRMMIWAEGLFGIYFQQFDIINVTRQQIITLTHCFKHYYHLDHYLCHGVSSLTLKEFCRCITTLVCFSQSLVPNLFLFKMKFVFNGNSTPVFAFTKDLIKIWLRSGISE